MIRARVGRYDLLRRLAIGGMGEIYLARERGVAGIARLVVVKLMLEELAENPEQVARFIDEARIAVQIAHPNVVQVYEFGEDQGVYFMAMEYVPGQNLARVCQRASRNDVCYPRHSAIHVVAEMARGLDYAHKANDSHGQPMCVVHRDISPQNVLISIQGDVKLLDFGIARANVRQQRTQTGVLHGKFAYMSPEQVQQAPLDPRSDVFSAGIVLWETTLMRPLFRGETEMDTLRLVARCEVPSPRSVDPDYPEDLEAAVMTALAADPNERFQSAGAMAAALRNVLKRRPRVEEEELGGLVLELFPETMPNDLQVVVRNTAPMAAVQPPAELLVPGLGAIPIGASDGVMNTVGTQSAASSLATPAQLAATDDAAELTPAPRPATRSRLGLWLAVVAVVAVVATVAVFVVLQGPEAGRAAAGLESQDAGGSGDAGLSVVLASNAGRDAAAALAQINMDAASTAPGPRLAKSREGRRSSASHRTRRSRLVDAGAAVSPRASAAADARPASVAARVPTRTPKPTPRITPPPAPNKGRIAVTSTPYGRVSINGKSFGPTDLVQALAPGSYKITVAMSDGSGTHSVTTRVEANKKTKCQVVAKRLRCQSPR